MTDFFVTHGDDTPSGENLEYDPEFMAMEIVAQPEGERQAGEEILEASDPDYKELASKAESVLSRSHDIRAAVYLADASIRLTGLVGFAEATKFIRFCLEEHWDTCHPELDEDDDDDPTMRINAVSNLAGRSTVLRGLRTWAPLSNSRAFGQITLRDIELSTGDIEPGADETPMSWADVNGAFMDTDKDELRGYYDAAVAALEDVQAIDNVFLEKTPGYGPSLQDLQVMLSSIVNHLAKATGADVEDEAEAAEGVDGTSAQGEEFAGGGGGMPGQINSRADVAAALEKILSYYARHEPSSPLPVLLMRAKRLVGADFITIINDMAPLGVENVNLVGGIVEDYNG